jgi:hypothetical protein
VVAASELAARLRSIAAPSRSPNLGLLTGSMKWRVT